jgi:hypothetical protein
MQRGGISLFPFILIVSLLVGLFTINVDVVVMRCALPRTAAGFGVLGEERFVYGSFLVSFVFL